MTVRHQTVSVNNHSTLKRQALPVIVLLAICLGIFSNTFNNEFVWDDPYLISDNRHIRHCRNIPRFFTPFYWNGLDPYSSIQVQYRPVRTTTFAIDYYLWKLNPTGYHLSNLLMHMANVVLIYYLLSVVSGFSKRDEQETAARSRLLMGLPFLTAVLFATHPIHTESVTYIKNRSELLAFMFFLVSFLLFVRDRATMRWIPRLLLLLGSLLSFALAVLSKETALTLPAVLVLYAVCFQGKAERVRSFIRVVPYCLTSLLYLWFITAMLNNSSLSADAFSLSTGSHLLTIVKTVGSYLAFLAFPFNLNAERVFFIPKSISEFAVVLSLVSLVAISLVAVKAWRRSRVAFFAIFYVLLTLVPAANIVYLGSRPLAEQRLYIPSFGLCLLVAWGIHHLCHRGIKNIRPKTTVTAAWLLVGLIVIGYSVITVRRNLDWRDPVTFFSRTIRSSPGSARMYNCLGVALAEQGRREEAMGYYETALRIDPAYAHVHNNLGVEFSEMGRFDEAVKHFKRAVDIDPELSSAHSNLGIALLEIESVEDSISHYKTAAKLKPDTEKFNNLGSAYAEAGRLEDALDNYLAALRIEPDFVLTLNNLGALLIKTGNIEQTVESSLSPVLSAWQLARVYNSVATIFLIEKEYNAAEYYYRETTQLDPTFPDGLYNLGLVLAFKKEYRAAAEVYAGILAASPHDKEARKRYDYCRRMMTTESE